MPHNTRYEYGYGCSRIDEHCVILIGSMDDNWHGLFTVKIYDARTQECTLLLKNIPVALDEYVAADKENLKICSYWSARF